MLVYIVYVPDAERRGPDLTRINTVEDIPDDLARMMVQHGEARIPTDEERAGFESTKVTVNEFDQGGSLPSGLNAYNAAGEPERVSPNAEPEGT